MTNLRTAKLAAGSLLAVAFMLPQYKCAAYHGPAGETVHEIPEDADPHQYSPFNERHYAWEGLCWSELASWIVVAVFFWPFPWLAGCSRVTSRRIRRVCWWLEPVLVAASVCMVWAYSSAGERALGGYVGLGANGVYGFAWLRELRADWIRRRGTKARAEAGTTSTASEEAQ